MNRRTIRGMLLQAVMHLGVVGGVLGQEPLPNEAAVEDLRFFLNALEEIHPDPYSAFGGKVEFKRRAQELFAHIPANGLAPRGIYDRLAPFLGDLGDGHTRLSFPATSGEAESPRVLPLEFGVATDAVFVERGALGYEDLVGYRLLAIEREPLDGLKSRASQILPAENEYGAARALARAIRSTRYAQQLFGRIPDTLHLHLLDPDSVILDRQVPYAAPDTWEYRDESEISAVGEFPSDVGPISWRILTPSNVGYLRLRSIEGREAFEEARGRRDLPGYVARYYTRYLGRDAPEDLDSALDGIPCFTQSVADLLTAMRDSGSLHLIVDVRSNGGGWSSLMFPLYLLAFGDAYVNHPFPDTWVDVASPQFLEMSGWTPDDLAQQWGPEYEVGDYRLETPGTPRADRSWHEYLERLEPLACGLASRVARLEGSPLHRVNMLVLTDSGTFSAAFQLAFHLWHLGAVLVGTPPAQSGNAYTNVMPIKLPNSGLTGSISRSAQIFFPGDDLGGRVLMPDFPMRWAEYARFGFHPDSELLYALELIAAGRANSVLGRD